MENSEWIKNEKIEIRDKSFDFINFSKLKALKNPNDYDFDTELLFENCSFNDVIFTCLLIGRKISFKNCRIENLSCVGTYFFGGFEMHNCHVLYSTSFESGVHNKSPNIFEITKCTFGGYVDFFDVYFKGPVRITNNTFKGSSNLEVYLKHPFGIEQGMSLTIENNTGNLKRVLDSDPIHGTNINSKKHK